MTSPAGTADRPDGPPSHVGGPPSDGPRLLPRPLASFRGLCGNPATGSAVYDWFQLVGVLPVVTVWYISGPPLRTRRYRPVFTFLNVNGLVPA